VPVGTMQIIRVDAWVLKAVAVTVRQQWSCNLP
jgi:hypothetical protein